MSKYRKYIKKLQFFNDKAKKLLSSSYTSSIMQQKYSIRYRKTKKAGSISIKVNNPTDESLDAFILTLRMFMQDSDPISLRNMSKIYTNIPTRQKNKKVFEGYRKELNEYLDSSMHVILKDTKHEVHVEDRGLTNRRILETFLYGSLAHLNKRRVVEFTKWYNNKLLWFFVQRSFQSTLTRFIKTIRKIRALNNKVLKELRFKADSID